MPTLKKIKTPHGDIRIIKSSDGSMSYYQNGCFHSQVDKRGVSICAYIHVIHEIIMQSRARNILIIGCAGGTLATMLQKMGRKVTVVDINAVAFTVARDYFKLPWSVQCITQDGVVYLRRLQKSYDAIVIDVFKSNNAVPHCFTTTSLFQAIKKALSPAGIMVMNFMTRDDQDKSAEKAARNAEAAGMSIRLFDWPGETDRNTLILGGGPAKLHIPSGWEPESVEGDMEGLTCRSLKRALSAFSK